MCLRKKLPYRNLLNYGDFYKLFIRTKNGDLYSAFHGLSTNSIYKEKIEYEAKITILTLQPKYNLGFAADSYPSGFHGYEDKKIAMEVWKEKHKNKVFLYPGQIMELWKCRYSTVLAYGTDGSGFSDDIGLTKPAKVIVSYRMTLVEKIK